MRSIADGISPDRHPKRKNISDGILSECVPYCQCPSVFQVIRQIIEGNDPPFLGCALIKLKDAFQSPEK